MRVSELDALLSSSILQVTDSGFGIDGIDVITIAQLGTGIFATILLGLSLYSWRRRRQPALLIIAGVFLLFIVKVGIEVLPELGNFLEFFMVLLDFLILALIFVAIALRPSRKTEKNTATQIRE